MTASKPEDLLQGFSSNRPLGGQKMQLEIPFRTEEKLVQLEAVVEKEMQEYREDDFLPEYKPTYKDEYVAWLYKHCETHNKEPKNFKRMGIRQLAAIYLNINKKTTKERIEAEIFLRHHHCMNGEDTPINIYLMSNKKLKEEVTQIKKTYQ